MLSRKGRLGLIKSIKSRKNTKEIWIMASNKENKKKPFTSGKKKSDRREIKLKN